MRFWPPHIICLKVYNFGCSISPVELLLQAKSVKITAQYWPPHSISKKVYNFGRSIIPVEVLLQA